MAEDKLARMEEMFLQSSKPKIVIDNYEKITRLGCLYDATNQGKNALMLAIALAKKLHLPLKIFNADDFNFKIRERSEIIKDQMSEMTKFVDDYTKSEQVATRIETLVGKKMQKILDYIEEDIQDEDKLSTLIINKLIEENFSIFIAGSPILKERNEEGNFGFYLRKLLKAHKITASFLLVPSELAETKNLILGLTNYRQKEDSKEIILKRAIALKSWIKSIHLVGIVEENTIATVARSELPADETDTSSNITEVRTRILNKIEDEIKAYELADKEIDLQTSIDTGDITAIIKLVLEEYKPGLIIVRNVAKEDENLDPEAETMSRIALTAGYPVLLVWD